MARCPDCNKFVGNEPQEPEVEGDPEVEAIGEATGSVRIEVRIVNACDQCGTELAEATLEIEQEFDLPDGFAEDHELEAEVASAESTDKSEGKGRGMRTFYGASVAVIVTSPQHEGWKAELTMEDFIQASAMDSCV